MLRARIPVSCDAAHVSHDRSTRVLFLKSICLIILSADTHSYNSQCRDFYNNVAYCKISHRDVSRLLHWVGRSRNFYKSNCRIGQPSFAPVTECIPQRIICAVRIVKQIICLVRLRGTNVYKKSRISAV